MDDTARQIDDDAAGRRANLARAIDQVSGVVLGKDEQIRLAFACLLADGHLLIQDRPGVGKTTLARALAITLGLEFQRIQFTSDLLPADVTGVSVFNRDESRFEFHPGPVISQVVLADEINRATPKAQSALLEAMSERQVTVDNHTHPLSTPFFVIATQNAVDLAGTFPLPDSQLDRFLMRLSLGYPDARAERRLLAGRNRKAVLADLKPCLSADTIRTLQATAERVHTSDALLDYVQLLLKHSRDAGVFREGLSPRAGLALLRCVRAWALIQGRDYCLPEDVQTLFPSVARHRLQTLEVADDDSTDAIEDMLTRVPIP